MNLSTSITAAITGSVQLMSGKIEGLSRFDFTVTGFWRSFLAAPLTALPYYLLLVLQPYRAAESGLDADRYLISGVLTFAIGWTTLPLLSLALCRYFGLTARFVPLIVVTNWMAVPQIAILLASLVLSFVLPAAIGDPLLLMITVAVIYVQWFAMKSALMSNGATALTFLLCDLLINQSLQAMIERSLAS